jgi:hypothetical protein
VDSGHDLLDGAAHVQNILGLVAHILPLLARHW